MANLDNILKSRDITLLIKIQMVKTVFSTSHVRIWELDHKEGCSLKNWCFRIVVLETLESPLDSRRSNWCILKEINPEYWLEGLMLKLKLQYFGSVIWVLSHFSHVQFFVAPWIAARQAPLFTGFSRQEGWGGLPFPSPGDLPHPGIKPISPMGPALAGVFFTTSPTKSWLVGKDIDAEKDWRQKEKRATGDEVVR